MQLMILSFNAWIIILDSLMDASWITSPPLDDWGNSYGQYKVWGLIFDLLIFVGDFDLQFIHHPKSLYPFLISFALCSI